MHFEPQHIYHVYNRGNNRQKIFFRDENYLFLLKKIRTEWLIYCDILCYCLMPNHFHFMLKPNSAGCRPVMMQGQASFMQVLSKTIGKTLSSYTRAINLQNKTTGNLFQKKTKAKCLTGESLTPAKYRKQDYLAACFHYIHNNPVAAGIAREHSQWHFSSWREYYHSVPDSICNKVLFMEVSGFREKDFKSAPKTDPDEKAVEGIW